MTAKIIENLFAPDSFTEIGGQSSVITGYGQISGMTVCAFIQEIESESGAVSRRAAEKIKKLYGMAVKMGCPVLGVYNSLGGDIRDGAELLSAYGDILDSAVKLSGAVPLISVVTGTCAGIMATICLTSDIVIATEKAEIFLTPHNLPGNKKDGKEELDYEKGGICTLKVKSDEEAAAAVKKLLSLLPQNNLEPAGNDDFTENNAPINEEMSGEEIINAAADMGSVTELYPGFGNSSYTALGSLGWRTAGFVAADKNDKKLSSSDCVKIARFVNFCDAFSLPVITFIDTEGFAADGGAESVRNSAKLAQVYAGATTPVIGVITGKAVGSALVALNAGADMTFAYEKAIISPAEPKTAAALLNSETVTSNKIEELTAEYIEKEASAKIAAGRDYIERVIKAEETKKVLMEALQITSSKRTPVINKKHINIVF